MKRGTTGQATIYIDALPETVYALVSDVSRMGEWSPECKRCVWLDGATGPAEGARFKGSNRGALLRWSTKPRVLVAEEGREFAFATLWRGAPFTQWTYYFEPSGDGTEVTESFEMMADQPAVNEFIGNKLMHINDRRANLIEGMQTTLERIKTAAERT
jgi:uncharacterized protein YndB with AHSA1/START domain